MKMTLKSLLHASISLLEREIKHLKISINNGTKKINMEPKARKIRKEKKRKYNSSYLIKKHIETPHTHQDLQLEYSSCYKKTHQNRPTGKILSPLPYRWETKKEVQT